MKYILHLLFLLFFSLPQALSQVIEVPLNENLVLKQHYLHHGDQTGKFLEKSGLNNSLPFLDDFTTPGPYPNSDLWENNQVYVNYGMGKNPPSYGVATFDGLNAIGRPYGGGYGSSDTLTSRTFDFSVYSSTDNIYLSYFIQAKGFGERPEVSDSLVLEFRNSSGSWVTIAQHAGLSTPQSFIPDFSQHFQPVTSTAYLHSNFQFRFRNYSSRGGFVDNWNLDYIKMDVNRSANETSFNDIACIDLPPDILRTYASMPFDQFIADIPGEVQLSAAMDITNHFGTGKEINPRYIKATEVNSNGVILPLNNLGQVNFTGGQTVVLSDQLSFGDFDFGVLPMSMGKAEVVTEYFYQTTGQASNALSNDTARTNTFFDDYYAYDDGTAEANVIALSQGTQVALMYHVNVADTIQAIQLHFQRVQGSVVNQQFNIYVWIGDLNSTPVTDLIFENPSYVDTINGFTQYNLDDPVFLESGDDFFVGWQQFTQTNAPIPIGFDKNNPEASQYAYQNLGGGWAPLNPSLQGALMIRPIMGYDLFVGNQELVLTPDYLNIFPNPVSDNLNIQLVEGSFSDYRYEIYDPLGRLTGKGDLEEQLNVSQLSNGLHFMRITHLPSDHVIHHKLVKID